MLELTLYIGTKLDDVEASIKHISGLVVSTLSVESCANWISPALRG